MAANLLVFQKILRQELDPKTIRSFHRVVFFSPKCTKQATHSELKWIYFVNFNASKNKRLWGVRTSQQKFFYLKQISSTWFASFSSSY
jgi:hypothetical protein